MIADEPKEGSGFGLVFLPAKQYVRHFVWIPISSLCASRDCTTPHSASYQGISACICLCIVQHQLKIPLSTICHCNSQHHLRSPLGIGLVFCMQNFRHEALWSMAVML